MQVVFLGTFPRHRHSCNREVCISYHITGSFLVCGTTVTRPPRDAATREKDRRVGGVPSFFRSPSLFSVVATGPTKKERKKGRQGKELCCALFVGCHQSSLLAYLSYYSTAYRVVSCRTFSLRIINNHGCLDTSDGS